MDRPMDEPTDISQSTLIDLSWLWLTLIDHIDHIWWCGLLADKNANILLIWMVQTSCHCLGCPFASVTITISTTINYGITTSSMVLPFPPLPLPLALLLPQSIYKLQHLLSSCQHHCLHLRHYYLCCYHLSYHHYATAITWATTSNSITNTATTTPAMPSTYASIITSTTSLSLHSTTLLLPPPPLPPLPIPLPPPLCQICWQQQWNLQEKFH